MSITTNKFKMSAAVSVLALLVMSSASFAQDIGTDVDSGVVGLPEELDFNAQPQDGDAVDMYGPIVTFPTEEVYVDAQPQDGDAVDMSEPVVTIPAEEVYVDAQPQDGDAIDMSEPVVTISAPDSDEGEVLIDDGVVDIVPLPAEVDGDIVTDVEPTDLHMLDSGTAVPAEVVETHDRAESASAIPNWCDTAAGAKNAFFCGSYHKK